MITFNSKNDKTTFEGIYKIKGSHNKKQTALIEKYIKENENVTNVSNRFKSHGKYYYYVLTLDSLFQEKMFEHGLEKMKVKYWKSKPLFQLNVKDLYDKIFEVNKQVSGKEIWIG